MIPASRGDEQTQLNPPLEVDRTALTSSICIKARAQAFFVIVHRGASSIVQGFIYSNMERAVMWLARLRLVLLLSLWYPGAQAARMLGELPPCKDVWGGIPGWDCFDPPTHDLPPCDFHHQRAGIDCWPKSPPKAAEEFMLLSDNNGPGRVEGALPSCNDVPGGFPCFDPPSSPLPPCDFKHRNPGVDCSTARPAPPARKAVILSAAPTQDLDNINAAAQSVQGQLPPCKDVPGGIQFLDCYDPPATPLPPCDFKHQNPGIDCSTDSQKPRPPPPAPKAKKQGDLL